MLPLISSLCAGLFGRFIGARSAAQLTTFLMGLNLMCIFVIFIQILTYKENYFITLGN